MIKKGIRETSIFFYSQVNENQFLVNKVNHLTQDVVYYKKENVAQEEKIKDLEGMGHNFQCEVHTLQYKLNKHVNKTNGFIKQLREWKKTNSDLQTKNKVSFLQDVATQCDQESQEKLDAKKKLDKN